MPLGRGVLLCAPLFVAAEAAVVVADGPLQEFPVPLLGPGDSSSLGMLWLVARGFWSDADQGAPPPPQPWPCVAVVPTPEDCQPSAFPGGGCDATALWHESSPRRFLGFQLPRPAFTVGSAEALREARHSVCLRRLAAQGPEAAYEVLGSLSYYSPPTVQFSDVLQHVSVRTFLNPGWRQEILLTCSNCTSANRLTVRVIDSQGCDPLPSLLEAATSATGSPVKAPNLPEVDTTRPPSWLRAKACEGLVPSPCDGFAGLAEHRGEWVTGSGPGGTAVFVLEGSRRPTSDEQRRLLRRRSALCFYPDEASPIGWLAGYVEFHSDAKDVQAFVGFVCFFGVALPLICLVTAMLHVNKQERCGDHVQQVRLDLQREQLQREIATRGWAAG